VLTLFRTSLIDFLDEGWVPFTRTGGQVSLAFPLNARTRTSLVDTHSILRSIEFTGSHVSILQSSLDNQRVTAQNTQLLSLCAASLAERLSSSLATIWLGIAGTIRYPDGGFDFRSLAKNGRRCGWRCSLSYGRMFRGNLTKVCSRALLPLQPCLGYIRAGAEIPSRVMNATLRATSNFRGFDMPGIGRRGPSIHVRGCGFGHNSRGPAAALNADVSSGW